MKHYLSKCPLRLILGPQMSSLGGLHHRFGEELVRSTQGLRHLEIIKLLEPISSH